MHNRRLQPGTVAADLAIGLVFLVATGCSQEEPLQPDPFFTQSGAGTAGASRTPGGPGLAGKSTAALAADDAADSAAPLRPDDVERQLRIALRSAEKGDTARAISLLDRILDLEPINREALSGRAAVALDESRRATSPEERAAAMEKAITLLRKLRRAYEKPNKNELDLSARVFYAQARLNVELGHDDRAVAALKESYEAGLDQFNRVEADEAMAKLRATPGYRAMVKGFDDANLARARQRIRGMLDQPVAKSFDFTLPDLDGKPIAIDQLRGKVVLVDVWGTWCKPCREALPGLARLYYKHRRRGLEVIGLDYEQDAPDPETARQYVKRFVQEFGVPYPCVIGDEETLKKIPNLRNSFPTTLLIDRSGKVRVVINENFEGALAMLDDAIAVLLAEPEAKAVGAGKADKPEAAKPR